MIRTKHTCLCAALLLVQWTIAGAQTLPEPATAVTPLEQTVTTTTTTAEPAAAATAPPAAPKEAKPALTSKQVPKLVIRWDCGDCEANDKVSPLIEKNYASKAAAKGYEVSDNETAEMVVIKYRQRPPGVRVMFGAMAGKDILETRVTFRGKEYLAGDYMANAWHGMDSLCESVAQLTMDHMLANAQALTGVTAASDKPNTQ